MEHITYQTNEQLWRIESTAASAGYKKTNDCYWSQIFRNLEADRLQILFDEKPDEETRATLKQNGFRWSPRYGAWQRQLTPNAEAAARRALGIETMQDTEKRSWER